MAALLDSTAASAELGGHFRQPSRCFQGAAAWLQTRWHRKCFLHQPYRLGRCDAYKTLGGQFAWPDRWTFTAEKHYQYYKAGSAHLIHAQRDAAAHSRLPGNYAELNAKLGRLIWVVGWGASWGAYWIANRATVLIVFSGAFIMFKKLMVATLGAFTAVAMLPAQAQTVLTSSSWVPPGHTLTRTIIDRKSTRLNSSHLDLSRMPSSA